MTDVSYDNAKGLARCHVDEAGVNVHCCVYCFWRHEHSVCDKCTVDPQLQIKVHCNLDNNTKGTSMTAL